MKLHDLRPAPGSHKKKTRVGRGIAAGKGKTAGRGTKGQKARAGGKIPAWFEGGQTPLHQRIPKLRGFKNPFKIDYEVVNVGAIAHIVELGFLDTGDMPGTKKPKAAAAAPITVNQEILRAAGLVRTLNKPMKILGGGELSTALFVVADAVSGSARTKIEAAGGTVSLLEVPSRKRPALGVEDGDHADEDSHAEKAPQATAEAADAADATEAPAETSKPAPKAKAKPAKATVTADEPDAAPAKARAEGRKPSKAKAVAAEPDPAVRPDAAEADANVEAAAEAQASPESDVAPADESATDDPASA